MDKIDNGAAIDVTTFFHELCKGVLAERPRFEGLRIGPICEGTIPSELASAVRAVVREAILNGIDHGHPCGSSGLLRLRCERDPSNSIIIEVTDDGLGLPEGFEPSWDGGDGLQLMRRASAEIGGELAFEWSSLGLTVSLRIPASAMPTTCIPEQSLPSDFAFRANDRQVEAPEAAE